MIEEVGPEGIRTACLGYLHSCLLKSTDKNRGRFISMIQELKEPTFYSGKAGLLAMLAKCKGI